LRRQVSELKKTIEETKNMTVQKLIYLGKILDEDKTLGGDRLRARQQRSQPSASAFAHPRP